MYGALTNIGGTTCALNTLVQLIAHSDKLYTSLKESFIYDNKSEDIKNIVWNIIFILEALRDGHSVTPGGLVSLIYKLFPNNFHHGEQMDIYELWMLIADKISDEISCQKTIQSIQPIQSIQIIHPINIDMHINSKVKEEVHKMNNGKFSAWLKNIQSIQLSVLKCLNKECGDTPWNVELFTSFQIDIPYIKSNNVENPIILDQLLLKNHIIEQLPEWKCTKCKNIGGIKQSQIYTLPIVLMLMLKRFRITENGEFKKINTPINISTQIKIELNGVAYNYRLIGIGNHYGVYGGGHYNAHVLEDPNWICFDDLDHYAIDLETNNIFINNKTAYMVCYEQI